MAKNSKNGAVAANDMITEASKAAQEANAVVGSMIEAANKAVEDSKPLVAAQQKMIENGLATYQESLQTYLEMVLGASRQISKQSLVFQSEMIKMAEETIKQNQELLAIEQSIMIDATEAYQAQIQAANQRVTQIFTPVAA